MFVWLPVCQNDTKLGGVSNFKKANVRMMNNLMILFSISRSPSCLNSNIYKTMIMS